ncbi:MAG: lipid A biosynthesis lauroyl acyltransferase [Pseudomonadota bacterium]
MRRLNTLMTRLGLYLLRWIGRRPLPRARVMTRWLARPMRWCMRNRARIAQRNLELCFPELDDNARKTLHRQHFTLLAESLGEIAFAWNDQNQLDASFGEVLGLEHLNQARANEHGVLLVTGHTTSLELSARLLAETAPLVGVYRPLKNQLLESFQNAGRSYAKGMLPRHDIRAMIRHLRAGHIVWTAMDQDFGPKRSIFAPFFGIRTATARGLLDLARLGNARVVPVYAFKDTQSGRITIEVEPAFESFPSGDPLADLGQYNRFIENAIRRAPAQYWWLHRRFKTAPDDEAPRYRC